MPNLNASSRIMFETAQRLGITCTLMGDRETILMAKDGKEWYTRGSRTTVQSSVGKTIADKKNLTKLVLSHFGLPTAKFIKVTSSEELHQLSELRFPVVMKPIDQRHGKGVVVGLESETAAQAAYQNQEFGEVLFEEMLQGTEYRIVCVDYQFVAAAFRKPAHVVGDGTHTIQQLIDEKNQHPWRGKGHEANLTLIDVDKTVVNNITEQNYTLESVLPAGTEVFLRKTANLSTGGEAWDVTDDVGPENRALFSAIAKACNLNIIGIDIMCQSLTEPIVNQDRAGVIEVNASPGLRMHHYPVKGQARDLAEQILVMTMNQV